MRFIILVLALLLTGCSQQNGLEHKTYIVDKEQVTFNSPVEKIVQQEDKNGTVWSLQDDPHHLYGIVIKPLAQPESLKEIKEYYQKSLENYKAPKKTQLIDSFLAEGEHESMMSFSLKEGDNIYRAIVIFTPHARHSVFAKTPQKDAQIGENFLKSYTIKEIK